MSSKPFAVTSTAPQRTASRTPAAVAERVGATTVPTAARGILMAIGSGIAIGAFFVTIDQTSEQSGVVPLLLNRAVTATIMFAAVGVLALVAARRRRGRTSGPAASGGEAVDERMPRAAVVGTVVAPTRSATAAGVRLAILCGAVDVTANGLLLIGIRAGDLSVAAVLGAMYPAGTILLAAVVLKERIAPVQWLGLVLALVAAGMLALA